MEKNKGTGEMDAREHFFPQLATSPLSQVTRELSLKGHRGQDYGDFRWQVKPQSMTQGKYATDNMYMQGDSLGF